MVIRGQTVKSINEISLLSNQREALEEIKLKI
jgi:hypothetical protein